MFVKDPQRITLGHTSKKRRSGTKHKEVLKEEEMMYIPLLESLKQMLNHDTILTEVICIIFHFAQFVFISCMCFLRLIGFHLIKYKVIVL
jgi:hypothetical protein